MSKLYKNRDWLYQKYHNENLSIWKIARQFNCDAKTIVYWFRKFSIPTKTRKQAAQLRTKGKLYADKNWLHRKYIKEKLNLKEVAELSNSSYAVIWYWMNKFNIPRRTISEAAQRGEKSSSWKGGRRIDSEGYVRIYYPDHPNAYNDTYIYEHRLVMEEHIGRYLKSGEIVHHIDGNKENNKIENLCLVTNATHGTRYADGYKEGFAKGFLISYLASQYKNSPK